MVLDGRTLLPPVSCYGVTVWERAFSLTIGVGSDTSCDPLRLPERRKERKGIIRRVPARTTHAGTVHFKNLRTTPSLDCSFFNTMADTGSKEKGSEQSKQHLKMGNKIPFQDTGSP